jgi:hypothetical protein
MATSAAVAGWSGAAAADVGADGAVDVPAPLEGVPAPLEQPASPVTPTATRITLAFRHDLVNIATSECQQPVIPSGDVRLCMPNENFKKLPNEQEARTNNHPFGGATV